MQIPSNWNTLLKIKHNFLETPPEDYRTLPPQIFSHHNWDLQPEADWFPKIFPLLRNQAARAARVMPQIYPHLRGLNTNDLRTRADWNSIPPLVKDDLPEYGLKGFRATVNENPLRMRPDDCPAATMAFGSGGSMGLATPTFVTLADRAREIYGWQRGHTYHGLTAGDTVLYTYNTTHKGGQWMQESLWTLGVNVHLRRPKETPEQVLDAIRAYGVNVLFTVQQPYELMNEHAKAAGINLHSLVMASLQNPQYRGLLLPDAHGRQQIEFIFLGGFPLVPYALQLGREYLANVPIATLLGSSEAIPQACSTNPRLTPGTICHHNNLHLLQAPHYIEILKPVNGKWVPVNKGETGLLVYTSFARDGTIWVRYAPGDAATLLLNEGECSCGLYSPVITDVHRIDPNEQNRLLQFGCAAG